MLGLAAKRDGMFSDGTAEILNYIYGNIIVAKGAGGANSSLYKTMQRPRTDDR
jgi:hypothetical protein